jgi:carbon monoxide dehydrogenase subunit G
MSEVHATIEIAAPPQQVWDTVMDPRQLQQWVTIHHRLRNAPPPGPAHEGDRFEQTLSLHGVHFRVRWELDTCREPIHAHWLGHGPARSHAEIEYRLAAADGGTQFDYRNEFRPPLGPLGSLASRALVRGLPQREADASLARLKALVEKTAKQ